MVTLQTVKIFSPVKLVFHIPVLVKEVVEFLGVYPGGKYIDATVGCGGHAQAILERGGRLLGLDLDPRSLEVARQKLLPWEKNIQLVQSNFSQLEVVASTYNFKEVDGILFDLGLSSWQLEKSGRGFSFQRDEPLDMRFSPDGEVTAEKLVNTLSMEELARILERFGEEKRARVYARRIVENRPLKTTGELVQIIEKARGNRKNRIHPATKIFQAFRIAVNDELGNLAKGLPQAVNLLKPGGRVVVISYHSLEDRIVKEFIRRQSRTCLCPPRIPVCICGHTPSLKILTTKPITPSPSEIKANPRSRSARMRVAERL